MTPLLGGLAPQPQPSHGSAVCGGCWLLEPLQVPLVGLLFGQTSVMGSLTGSSIENADTLNFSVLQEIRAQIETVPLTEAPQAYARMMRNEARFRMVITVA